MKSLRSKYSYDVILEKLKEANRKKGEETWKCTFDTSKDKNRKLGFLLSESEQKDKLLVL